MGTSVCYLPGKNQIVSASRDKTLKLWTLPEVDQSNDDNMVLDNNKDQTDSSNKQTDSSNRPENDQTDSSKDGETDSSNTDQNGPEDNQTDRPENNQTDSSKDGQTGSSKKQTDRNNNQTGNVAKNIAYFENLKKRSSPTGKQETPEAKRQKRYHERALKTLRCMVNDSIDNIGKPIFSMSKSLLGE